MEVVLDRLQDNASINVAYTPNDILPASVALITQNLERMVIEVGNGLQSTFETRGDITHIQPAKAGTNTASDEDDDDEQSEAETQTMVSIRDYVSDFLSVDASIIPFTASLFSFGLDSIKSLGLSRKLRDNGYAISAAELMRRQTLRRIAAYFRLKAADSTSETVEASNLLKNALDGIVKEVDVPSLKLHEDDSVSIFPATALQSGMLSQVRWYLYLVFLHQSIKFLLLDR